MHATNIVIAVLLSWAVYLTGLVVYRLWFHPLAKYPGPFLAKTSYFYAFYHAWIKDTAVAQLKCHQKYGHAVRYNPDSIMFDDPAAFREIYGFGKNFARGRAYAPMNADPHARPNILFNKDNKNHAWRKRIIQQAFSERALRQSQVYIKDHIDTLSDILNKMPVQEDGKWSQNTNIEKWIYWCIQDSMTDLVFGRSYNMLTDPAQRGLGEVCLNGLNRDHLVFQYPGLFTPGLNKWNDFGTWFMPAAVGEMMKFMAVGAGTALQRIETPAEDAKDRKDVLNYLLTAKDKVTGTGLEKEDVVAEACILLLAGGSTTAHALSSLFFYLSRDVNSMVFKTLAREIRSTFARPEDICLENIGSCTYLSATITENMRFVAGTAWWRDAQHHGATITIPDAHEYGSKSGAEPTSTVHFIPEGYTAGCSDFAIARNDSIYPDAYSFAPERFIPTSDFYTSRGFDKKAAQKAYELARSAHHPFIVGTRACVAESLALALMQLLTATLVWHFDFKQGEGKEGELGGGNGEWGREHKDEYQIYGSFTLKGSGPVVQFQKREGQI